MWQRDDLLAAFRDARGPSPEAVERIAERLEALGPAPQHAKVIELAPARRVTRTTRIAIAVAALAAAAVLGWWIRGVTFTPEPAVHGSLAEDRVESETNLGHAESVERGVATRRVVEAAPSVEPAPSDEAAPSVEAAPRVEPAPRVSANGAARARAPRRVSTVEPAIEVEPTVEPAVPESDSLKAETAMVFRARAQLSRGQAREALATLAEHARKFPQAKLGQESAAVRTMAQCRLHPDEAPRLRATFVERHATSLFRKQVEAACPAAEKGEGE